MITIQAPAKLNLALAVADRDTESDGLHAICSWMATVDLFDDVQVTRLPSDRLSRYAILWHPDARQRTDINWSIRTDLAVRAHLALEQHIGRPLPVQLKLEKRIPVGAGLGGGSSDAAAMLRAVDELFELELTDADLLRIAHSLGSDVPFFLSGGSAIVEGRGEAVQPLPEAADFHSVLIFINQQTSTTEVYALLDDLRADLADAAAATDAHIAASTFRDSQVRELARSAMPHDLRHQLFNDLAAPAERLVPALAEHRRQVAEIAEEPVLITGSGSSMFVLCDSPAHAEALAEAIESRIGLTAIAVQAARTSTLQREGATDTH